MKQLRNLFVFLVLFAALLGSGAYYLYRTNALSSEETCTVYVYKNDTPEDVFHNLEQAYGLRFPWIFRKLAYRMKLENGLKNGRYTIPAGANMVQVIRLFREGKTKTSNLVVSPLMGLEKLAARCGNRLEPDSAEFYRCMQDSLLLDSLGFNRQTAYALFIPDTYNLLWHTAPEELMLYMLKVYQKFWNAERTAVLQRCGLSAIEVATLASIVAKETNKTDEMPVVAGMYINRLRKDMPLQADPTVKFALNQPGLKRIYSAHLQFDSPYNTYLNKGLPPGPICIPPLQAIEAVLHYSEHNYLFMCAKEDFSGYHNFSADYATHLRYAARYRQALDERGIR